VSVQAVAINTPPMFDLNGEANTARAKDSSAIITP